MKSNSKVIDSSYFNNILYLIFNFLENVLFKKQLLYLKNKKTLPIWKPKDSSYWKLLRCSFFYEIVIQHFDHRRSRF